ncbi:MAG: serine acetyltransferase [Magnetococcales bacterium]|nr:serine acetyltransferase [Magnetococcales bacterium]
MSFKELIKLIRSDIHLKKVWFLHKESGFVKDIRVFLEPGTIAVITYRYGHWVRQMRVPIIKQILFLIYVICKMFVVLGFGIYIPSTMKVGKGFAIHNFSGIFLPRTTVGDNFIVFQNVTVGHLRGQGGNPPRIGNNVMLAAGSKVLGNLTIGDNVLVGANSVVVRDVASNSSVIGVPARVISNDMGWMTDKLAGRGDNW